MTFKVKGQMYINMILINILSKSIGSKDLVFYHVQPHDQPWGQNLTITFHLKSQGHGVNEPKPFSYKLLVVDSSL